MFCYLGKLLPNLTGLISIVAVVTVSISRAVGFEMRSIECGRESVGRFEIAHEVTLVV
jgi:hypothetical protein